MVSLAGTDPLSMSHIVGRELPTGTICIFTAELQDTWGDILCNETANCTVGGMYIIITSTFVLLEDY